MVIDHLKQAPVEFKYSSEYNFNVGKIQREHIKNTIIQ